MKLTEKQVVFYSAEKDGFLGEYKDRGTLAFEASFSEGLKKRSIYTAQVIRRPKRRARQAC